MNRAAPAAAKARILVIEDDPAIRALIYEFLVPAGYRVFEAGDGKEGLRMFASQMPHLVITDMLMPEKDGIETIVAIRRDEPNVGIIGISGGGRAKMLDFLNFAKTVGATEILPKPFTREQLLGAAQRVLAQSSRVGD